GETAKKGCSREAFEEAGVEGSLLSKIPMTLPISKSENGKTKAVAVTYYPMLVEKQFDEWPESSKRQRHWATLEDAQKVTDREDFITFINIFTYFKPQILYFAGLKKETRQAQPTQAR
ncbi:MAG: NUDIX hydrolase, partial [Pseudomonadota bacterium]|nr:NUDIX hydrolase [Pseudomonadota bacterium]